MPLSLGPRDIFLWDSEIPGFGCKVTPKGGRIYLLQYSRNDRAHRVTIGRHGVEFTAEQARNEARRLRGLIASGENPAAERLRDRSMPTVAGAWTAIPRRIRASAQEALRPRPRSAQSRQSRYSPDRFAESLRDRTSGRHPRHARCRGRQDREGRENEAPGKTYRGGRRRSSPTACTPFYRKCLNWRRTGHLVTLVPIHAAVPSASPNTKLKDFRL